ncbi:acyl-CoA dehydrogenase family protein [Bradyrhizobium sp. USDA 4451]
MTIHPGIPNITDDALHKRFAPIFETIAAGAVARERNRTLPTEQIRLLKEAGFGALRVPIEFGGLGATLRQTFDLLIELAAADSNLPQALRAHFNLVEDLQLNEDEAVKARWLGAIAKGALFGVAVTEPGLGAVDRYRTAITSDGTGLRLNGLKYYTTGTLYADHLLVAARPERQTSYRHCRYRPARRRRRGRLGRLRPAAHGKRHRGVQGCHGHPGPDHRPRLWNGRPSIRNGSRPADPARHPRRDCEARRGGYRRLDQGTNAHVHPCGR